MTGLLAACLLVKQASPANSVGKPTFVSGRQSSLVEVEAVRAVGWSELAGQGCGQVRGTTTRVRSKQQTALYTSVSQAFQVDVAQLGADFKKWLPTR